MMIERRAQAVVDAFTARDYHRPHIDRNAADAALARHFAALEGRPWARTRWFSTARALFAFDGRKHRIGWGIPAYELSVTIAVNLTAAWTAAIRDNPLFGLAAPERDLLGLPVAATFDVDGFAPLAPPPERFVRLLERLLEEEPAERSGSQTPRRPKPRPRPTSSADVARTAMADAFAAGLFRYFVTPEHVICLGRPALWITGGRLHREDGPAVQWPHGDAYWFWKGIEVPAWVVEEPETITVPAIRREWNRRIRHAMIDRYGVQRFLHDAKGRVIDAGQHGKLWIAQVPDSVPYTALEVENGTAEPDGTRRHYFLTVPPEMTSAHAAVAWTYGLTPDRYDAVVRT